VWTAFLSALFFLFHPFNSWYSFQGAWVGNCLALVAMIFAWLVYEKLAWSRGRQKYLWTVLVVALGYLACLCKDNGAFLPLVFLPLTLWSSTGIRRNRVWGLAASVLAVVIYFVQRTWVLPQIDSEIAITSERFLFSLSHAASAIVQYVFYMIQGTNFHYCRLMKAGWGWPLTLSFFLILGTVLWKVRRFSLVAILLWCASIFLIEIIVGSAARFHIVPSRATLLLGISPLLAAAAWRVCLSRYQKRWLGILLLGGAILWFGTQSVRHVWASLDQDRFYRYHNGSRYSWAILTSWGILSYDRRDWAASEEAFRLSVALLPRSVGYYSLGNALLKQGRFEEAIQQYREAMRLRPSFVYAHYAVAYALSRQGRFKEAIP
jgi:hypothetical protein